MLTSGHVITRVCVCVCVCLCAQLTLALLRPGRDLLLLVAVAGSGSGAEAATRAALHKYLLIARGAAVDCAARMLRKENNGMSREWCLWSLLCPTQYRHTHTHTHTQCCV